MLLQKSINGPLYALRPQAEISACQLFALYSSFRAAIKVGTGTGGVH